MRYSTNMMFLDIFEKRHLRRRQKQVSETFWKINEKVFFDKDNTMDNVQKHDICIFTSARKRRMKILPTSENPS
jgi:hypothetical protein